MFFRKKIIGIDISDYSIEALSLNRSKEILAYNRVILEEGIVQDGKILKKEELTAKLKELLENTKPHSLKVKKYKLKAILSLPESKIFIHSFEAPQNLQGEELKRSVFEEASKIIPIDAKRIYWDYIAVPGKEFQRVLFIGTLKEIVDEYVEILHSVDLEPIFVDVESLSLSRVLLERSSLKSSSMIIDIGARTTNASIFNRDGILVLLITIPVAGNHFTKTIAERLKIENEEAEKLKKTFGFDDEKPDNKVLSVLQASLQKIIKEIKDVIAHYERESAEKIEEIVLAGGSALLPKIDEYLSVNLEKKVRIGDPLKKIQGNQLTDNINTPPILFANVIGLALRGIGNVSSGINLLPEGISVKHLGLSQENKLRKSRVFIVSFAAVILVVLGFILYNYVYKPFAQQGEGLSVTKVELTLLVETPLAPQEVITQETPTGWLNVRTGPGTNYDKITRVQSGETYTLLEEKDNWYKIKINEGTEGWITSQYAIKK